MLFGEFHRSGDTQYPRLSTKRRSNRPAACSGGGHGPALFRLGQYEIVVIAEAPDDEAMATATLGIGSIGNIRTTTLKTFTQDEFFQLIERLPNS